MARSFPPLALALAAALSSCAAPGKAERIGTRPDGGSLMLSANNDKAWESAKEIMSSHCDGRYRVTGQSQESRPARGGPPPATAGAMADPIGPAGGPYGIRVDYACVPGTGPLDPVTPVVPPAGTEAPAPSQPPAQAPQPPQVQTPVRG